MDNYHQSLASALKQNDLLKDLFTNTGIIPHIDSDMKTAADEILKRIDARGTATLDSVLESWRAWKNCAESQPQPNEPLVQPLCNDTRVFNPQTKKYMDILKPPGGRKKKVEFDPYEFLLDKIQNQGGYVLHFRSDLDIEDTLDLLYCEDRERKEAIGDANIRRLTEVAHVLNNDSLFRVLDYQSEKYIS